MENLPGREELFKVEIRKLSEGYESKMLWEFFNYWSEPNKRGKMKWELEKTWDLKKRLARWLITQKKFINASSKTTNKGKSTGAYELLEEIREDFNTRRKQDH